MKTRQDSFWYPALDVRETAEAFELTIDVPGVKRENIDITLDDDVLKIEGSRKIERSGEESDDNLYRRFERTDGSFKRALRLPVHATSEDISATVNDGVLVITVRKQDEVKPKRIEIQS